MSRWWSFCILFCGCLIAGLARAAVLPGQFSDEVGAAQYDCILNLLPAEGLSYGATVRLTLEAGEKPGRLVAQIKRGVIYLDTVDMKPGKSVKIYLKTPVGKPYHLTFMRRGENFGIMREDELIYRGAVPRAPGTLATVIADKGWTVNESRIQALDAVVFADNFMRTQKESEQGNWTVVSGKWALTSAWDHDPKGNANRFYNAAFAQNPFAWAGRSKDGPALCTAGQPFWENYTLTAAVCPAEDGVVGLVVNAADAKNFLLVRWTPGDGGNTLSLFQVTDGKSKPLSVSPGGYVPGQWYKLTVVSALTGVSVLVDGQQRLTAAKVTPWRGGIGLYTEGDNPTTFDDVTAYGGDLRTDLLREKQQIDIDDTFANDKNGMKEWAEMRRDWKEIPTQLKHMVHVDRYYGEYWLTLTVKPIIPPTNMNPGELWLNIEGDGADILSGYRAVIKTNIDNKTTVSLFRGQDVLAEKDEQPFLKNEDYELRLRHQGNRVWLEIDGESFLEAKDDHPLSGEYPGYYADGCLSDVKNILVTGHNLLDYTFSDAPTDWIGEGTWMTTSRWACSPSWSFLGGWSPGDAILWHKQRFTGDQSFEAFFGPKMEYPRERTIYDYHYRDFSISICSDGRNPRSGYTGIYGAPDDKGNKNKRSVLMKDGEVVASDTSVNAVAPNKGAGHREWFDLALRKYGDTVEFWVEGKQLLVYKDPKPIAGGIPAIWTSDNGIMLARACIHFANLSLPANLPRVTRDDPWYPQWANIGQPMKLPFPHAWSSTGKPVTVKATPREVPAADASAVTFEGKTAVFSPVVLGSHWYQLAATDGVNDSQPFHLLLPVFDPAKGRDDSHALVLYRFDEGKGNVITDRSPVAPALNITFPDSSPVEWQPGQGLTLHGPVQLATAAAKKLMAIADSKACTFEAWVSTDTLYPPSSWSGSVMSWEGAVNQPNLQMMHRSQTLCFQSIGENGAMRQIMCNNFRTSLQHYAVTWDGNTITCYLNGVQVYTVPLLMDASKWNPDAPLLLGSSTGNQFSYFGTYYLVAIHNTCFTPVQVKRQYEAGPSAK